VRPRRRGHRRARLTISAWLEPEQINEGLMDELDALHPYGQGNPEPVFGLRGILLAAPPAVFKEQHFRFGFEDRRGRRLHGVAWKMARLDLAVELTWNHYNDRKLLQLALIDWKQTEA
jgi:single-stranded-DNA-specific exonuclease